MLSPLMNLAGAAMQSAEGMQNAAQSQMQAQITAVSQASAQEQADRWRRANAYGGLSNAQTLQYNHDAGAWLPDPPPAVTAPISATEIQADAHAIKMQREETIADEVRRQGERIDAEFRDTIARTSRETA